MVPSMVTKPITPVSVAILAVGLLAVGCGGGDGGSASPDPDATTDSTAVDAAAWEREVPGGECQCSDGSEFRFWVREANPEKVLVYLRGGGACWSAETCAQDGSDGSDALYETTIGEHPSRLDGIFDLTNESNPFADYSIVYVPYCTGDVFIGNATTTYADGLTVQHKGYVNGTAALDHLAATFPEATDVVVAGLSASSVAAPLYGGLVSDRLPDAEITVLADGSGAYPDDLPGGAEIAAAWGMGNTIPDWPETAGLTAEQWMAPTLFVQSGRHDPDITFARHDYAYDHTMALFNGLLGVAEDDVLSLIDTNETQVEAAGVNLLGYTAPGDNHGVLPYEKFYTEEVNGEKLVDWVTRLVAGEPVDDVHCTECTAG
jgi:Pectinacetylesterase